MFRVVGFVDLRVSLAFARMRRAPVLVRRHRLWPTVSVAVPLRRVEKHGEDH